MGRIYSTAYGWSQYSTVSGQHVYWGIARNTSVWDSSGTAVATIDSVLCNAVALRIHPGAKLKIGANKGLTCTGATEINEQEGLRILSDATGTGSFIDNGTITYNTGGTAKVERYFPQDTLWHYWSMPVTSDTAGTFIGMYMRWFDEPTYTFKEIIPVGTVLHKMWGYSLKSTGTSSTRAVTDSLNTGTLTTATLTSTLLGSPYNDYDGWNFVGNPYPSSTDWEQWTRNNVDTTMYCWDQNVYKTYNAYTHSGTKGDKYLRPEQGFFVHVSTQGGTGTASVTNATRSHQTGSYNKSSSFADMLVLTCSGNGIDDIAHVVFNAGATLNFDKAYDAYKLMGATQAPNLYSVLPDGNIAAVNWLPWTGVNQVVPLGFTCGIPGVYEIDASNMESFNPTTEIFIEDLRANVTQNLRTAPVFNFNYAVGEDPNRFLLHFTNTSLGMNTLKENRIRIYSFNDIVFVKDLTGGTIRGAIRIYDLTGKNVFSGTLEDSPLNRFRPGVVTGFYTVRVQTDETVATGKVFINQN